MPTIDETTLDGEHSALKAIVIGAGIAGLAAAIALRQEGHDVQIFEKSAMLIDIGAALGVPPNAGQVLKKFGYDLQNLHSAEWHGLIKLPHNSSEAVIHRAPDCKSRYGFPWTLAHRVDLHEELKRLAFDSSLPGKPASIRLQSRVVDCNTEQATITLEGGEVIEGDIIIGADGIRSTIRDYVLGERVTAPPSHFAGFRFVIDAAKLEGRPELSWVLGDGPEGPRFVDSRDGRHMFLYPCRSLRAVNCNAGHIDKRDVENVSWNAPTTTEELLRTFEDYDDRYRAFLALAPDTLRIWQIRSLPALRTWTNGRTCVIGDAAHAMLPTCGQGAAQCIEDAGTLGVLLPLGTTRNDVPRRLHALEELRKERADFVVQESIDEVKVKHKLGLHTYSSEMQDRLMGYDALAVAEKYFDEHFRKATST